MIKGKVRQVMHMCRIPPRRQRREVWRYDGYLSSTLPDACYLHHKGGNVSKMLNDVIKKECVYRIVAERKRATQVTENISGGAGEAVDAYVTSNAFVATA